MAHGILLRLIHTGLTNSSVLVADVDLDSEGPRTGSVYVPVDGSVTVLYSKTVPKSFESGEIRRFIDNGLLSARFILGTEFTGAVNNIVEPTVTPHNLSVTTDYCLVNPAPAVAFTVNLPSGLLHEKKVVTIKDKAQMAGNPLTQITVNAFAGQTIEGLPAYTLTSNGASVTLVFNGTNWSIV